MLTNQYFDVETSRITMTLNYNIVRKLCFCMFLTTVAESADFVGDSYEINRVDFSPFNDAVLINDIAEIINDFDSTMYSPVPSESDSDENIEDLLSEYQHYLDKAHKQKKNYEEKFKSKNKVPLLRHEKFSKMKSFSNNKYTDYFKSFSNPFVFTDRPINNQLDLFVPFNPDLKYFHRPEAYNVPPRIHNRGDNDRTLIEEKQLTNLPPPYSRTNYDLTKAPCICKDNQIPCDCNCKQCLISSDPPSKDNFDPLKRTDFAEKRASYPAMPLIADSILQNSAFSNRFAEASDSDLNIHIKVDIQLPKILESIMKQKNLSQDKVIENDLNNSKEARFLNDTPAPKFNFPIPLEIFGFKKPRLNKHDASALHKITIHKKKKSKLSNNGNKKHKKKIITFHNIKFEPQVVPLMYENYNSSGINKVIEESDFQPQIAKFTNNTQKLNDTNLKNHSASDITSLVNTSMSVISESISEIPFVIHNIENKTDDFHKTENSIETDFMKTVITNTSTVTPKILRSKRSITDQKSAKSNENDTSKVTLKENNKDANPLKNTKESTKLLNMDSELLYWPNNTKNYNSSAFKNITQLIIERENNKVKLNISQETIRKNHTMAVENAIFGNVDWNDVDTVAPVFLSFMGKYITGVLTFCSQKVCHSMKCFEKSCVHRICLPEERFNQRGHCIGSNKTDSIATMEAIMDLPSNIAFEIVDILQEKMLGKMFGKLTLCISSKCISLVSSKKNFLKSKCSKKELDPLGHCSNLKPSKMM